MKLTDLAVSRPVTVSMVVCVALILGIVSLSKLAVDLLPELNFPAAAVATSYEGAGPKEVESLVSRPLEEAMTTIGGVKEVSSTSSRGQSVVIVEFNWGTDMDFATLEMREKVDLIRPTLPEDAGSPRVLKFDPASTPIIQLGMGGARKLSDLKQLAEDVVKSRLESLKGVASVRVSGGQERQVHVLIDPTRMSAHGLSFGLVEQALHNANLNLPGGRIASGTQELNVRTTGEFTSLGEIGKVPVTSPAGGTVEVREVADVAIGRSRVDQLTRLNGQPSISLEILKETGANTVQVARLVHDEVAALQKELGKDIDFVTVSDESEFIEGSIQSVVQNAVMGGILAMIVLFAFLGNIRLTTIIGTAIPISIIFTFMLVYFSGMTLNMMSLGGLALGVGMLVDNAIVVLENVYRHLQQGKTPNKAATEGTSEVGVAIIASTLTTVAVFLPVVFIEGLASQIFRDLSLTVTYSLLASLAVSLTLIPSLASRWVNRHPGAMTGELGDPQTPGVLARVINALTQWYGEMLRHALVRRWWVLGITALIFAGSLLLIPRIGMEFLPNFDVGQIQVDVEMPRGTRLEETDRALSQIEQYVTTIPDTDAVFVRSGSGDAPDEGQVIVHLVPKEKRRESTRATVEKIRAYAATVPGLKASVSESSGFAGGGLGGAPIQVELRGNDLPNLKSAAAGVATVVRSVRGTRDVSTSVDESRPELQVHINRERAGRLGLNVAQVASAVRTAIEGDTATLYRTGSDEFDVVVRLADSYRRNREDLLQVPIGTSVGVIPLSEIAVLQNAQSPVTIDRLSQERVVSVNAQLYGRALGDVMGDIKAALKKRRLPSGVHVTYGGDDQQMNDAFGDLGLALVLAIILVYAVLASQFESLLQPLAIVFSVPFAFIGVIWGLVVSGHTLSAPAFVGVIMLAGIVVNNAIVLIDFVNQLRQKGYERTDALVEAGRARLRPILMTTSTTVLGMIPLALGLGEGSEIQAPMAVVVIGGLTVSTLLTLVVIPTIYALLDGVTLRLRNQKYRNKKGASPA